MTGCSRRQALAGDRFRDATVARSLTDSRELEELGAGDGGSSFKDSLKTPLGLQQNPVLTLTIPFNNIFI